MIELLAMQFTSPGPVVVEFGPVVLRWYGLLIATALLIGVTLSQAIATKRKLEPDAVGDAVLWIVGGAIPCARIYYVLFNWSAYAGDWGQMVAIWRGGIAIHGAILGGILGGWLFSRLRRTSFWALADVIAPSLILGQAIGRWGNFFNSEAFGAPTDLPWKLYIPADRRPPAFANVDYFHPTFLYESLWNLAVFCGLMLLLQRDRLGPWRPLKNGTLFCVYAIAYSLGRFWIEGLRLDSLTVGGLRAAQLVSIAGISLGALGLVWLYGLRRSLPDIAPRSSQG
ncbi:MAG: prolipoprotein diacylglyceryl transferase [Cyanobacteria bacterium]|nr:prolipoprotein diacylglyceryl transferase [Cyanobacteriota bacterium]